MNQLRAFFRYLLSAVCTAAITLLACYLAFRLDIPNPVIILVVIMIIFTAIVSNISGAVSGICIILYSLFFFSNEHNFLSFTPENKYKCLVIIISLPIIYFTVATIRKKKDDAFERLIQLNQQLEEQNEILEDESDHDALTGIYNRRGGDKKVAEYLEKNKDSHLPCILAAIDIDDFKNINDVYGHAAGDQALQFLVDRMKEAFPQNSVLIRNGGDEFQAFLCGTDRMNLEQIIRDFSMETFHFVSGNQEIDFQISCGYAVYPEHAGTQKDLYRKADVALYDVKMHGKHLALPYTIDADAEDRGRMKLSMQSISKYLPTAFLVYRADQNEEILIASATLLDLCGCNDFREFIAYTGGTFHGLVYPEDLNQVEKSIEEQIHTNERALDTVDYRIQTRDGRLLRIRDLGHLVHDPNLGDLFYVALYDRDATSVVLA